MEHLSSHSGGLITPDGVDGRIKSTAVRFVFSNYINDIQEHVILGLDPRIHAASHGPTNVLAEPAFRGGSWFLQPGVDGRIKSDRNEVGMS
jgi:hypothetical protein